ncbi:MULTISPECIES: hypothetical protein [unclassified Stenotrophomonas]|uniref:hypothetical protein n=1 Tax=unclassified Stenotrophomonas TaxID=196198 RepID=UPI0028AA60B6|nr:hypothetical protein [Stenotrophomonas sp.]
MRHPHRHRSFATAMRGQRPALPVVLAWLAVLAMLFTGLPVLERVAPGSTVMVLQMPMDERPVGGGETAVQEDTPAKPRRVASARPASTPPPQPSLPPVVESLDALMATLVAQPPRVVPAIDSAPATPLPAAPGLRVQRGQAPPQG